MPTFAPMPRYRFPRRAVGTRISKQICLKYGDLPASVQLKIEQADTEQLEHWVERIFIVESVGVLLE